MTVLERWFEQVWNQGNEAAIDELLAPGAIVHGLTDANGKEFNDIESFKAMYKAFRSSLSDIHVEVEDTVSEGEKEVARCLVTATHTGEGLGKPPLGRPINFSGVTMARVKDGRIAEGWNFFDFPTMFAQME